MGGWNAMRGGSEMDPYGEIQGDASIGFERALGSRLFHDFRVRVADIQEQAGHLPHVRAVGNSHEHFPSRPAERR